MMITDACVFPYPNGLSSVRRMAQEAAALGFDSIVAADTPSCTAGDIPVFFGLMISAQSVKEVTTQVKRGNGPGVIVSVQARDNGFNRAVCGMRGVHILRDIHLADKYAFDHVTAKIAAESGTAIDLDLSPLISGRGHVRQKAIHRYLDILTLRYRYKFPLTISSGARSVLGMRSVREISGICSIIGMDEEDIEQALGGVAETTAPKEMPVRVIS
ncbi:MAG: ribonuclease P [Methanoregula sp.]|nr:ribonuclease P [Methanoregula sp.]